MAWGYPGRKQLLMPRIDAHQHFWQFDPVRDAWITAEMAVLRQHFMPEALHPRLLAHGLEGCIAVQADQSEQESHFLLQLAEVHDFIKGVVGWIDLQAPDLEERLNHYRTFDRMKGFRHILQAEVDRAFMLNPLFKRGIDQLRRHGFTYDILIFPDQLQHTLEFVKAFPEQPFVIDHLAKPNIKAGEIDHWEKAIRAIARQQNVYCKLSGLITEADWQHWRYDDLLPYLDVVVEAFGTKRIMYGSDWPVCLLAGGYEQVVNIMERYFSAFSTEEQALFWGGNAARFYQIKP